MLRGAGTWSDLTADFVLQTGLGVLPGALLAQAVEDGDSVI